MSRKSTQDEQPPSARRAHWCGSDGKHPVIRVFLRLDEQIPDCPSCKRPMGRQANKSYLGRPT